MKNKHLSLVAGISLSLLIILACSLPGLQATPEAVEEPTALRPSATSTSAPSASEPPATIPPISHEIYPADMQTGGKISYDVDSSPTAPENRAPYGDIYRFNTFERPFTSIAMDYLPDADILTFRMQADPDWYYFFIELSGVNPESGAPGADYAVEFDVDIDGFGDLLVWAMPPYSTDWSTQGLSIHQDTNHDSAGVSITHSDAPFNGDGYDTRIFDSGQGDDPDLAWVRIDPYSSTTIQFAVKRSLPGAAFMWGVWADYGLKDPARFSYNDYFTELEAGSPEKSEVEHYPIKEIHSVDNTCREGYGFDISGKEPFLCVLVQPQQPAPGIAGCVNPGMYHDSASCTAAGCSWERDMSIISAIVYYCTYP